MPKLPRSRSLAVFFAVVAACAASMGSVAQAAWNPPSDVSASDAADPQARLAVDGAGDITAAWVQSDGTTDTVDAASRPAGGSWETPTVLSSSLPQGSIRQVVIAVDATGNETAAWIRQTATGLWRVETSSRPVGGSWSSAATLTETTLGIRSLSLAAHAGAVTALWVVADESNPFNPPSQRLVQWASRPASGSWSAAANLTSTNQAFGPQVAIDPAGSAIAVWDQYDGTNDAVVSSSRASGGSWAAPVTVSSTGGAAPAISMNASGELVALWHSDGALESASRTAGGSWGSPTTVVTSGDIDFGIPTVALDNAGVATAVWFSKRDISGYGPIDVRTSTLAPGSTWTAPISFSAVDTYDWSLHTVASPTGVLTSAWGGYSGTPAQASQRSAPGDGWSSPDTLWPDGASVDDLVVDQNGVATALLSVFDNTNSTFALKSYSTDGTVPPAAPDTTIDSGPSDVESSASASFTFASDTAGVTFQCQLDGGGWASCSSPANYTGLSDDYHSFAVRAVASSGADPSPATRVWQVDVAGSGTADTGGSGSGSGSGSGTPDPSPTPTPTPTSTPIAAALSSPAPPATSPVPQIRHCVVPSLTGKPLARAKKLLRSADCAVGRLRTRKGKKASRGRVVSQSTHRGAHLPEHSKIALVIGR
jgi:hypothetical protein